MTLLRPSDFGLPVALGVQSTIMWVSRVSILGIVTSVWGRYFTFGHLDP